MSANKVNESITRYTYGNVNFYSVESGQGKVIVGCVPELYEEQYAEVAANADAVILLTSKPEYAAGLGVLIKNKPNIAVYASAAGLRNIKEIINCNINEHIIKDGAVCEPAPGLIFCVTPGVHWVDTVTAVYKGALFSGELFSGFGTDNGIEGFYERNLYVNRGFVRSAIEKLSSKSIELICPAYGNVIVPENISEVIAKYREFSVQRERKTKKAVVVYASLSGFTEILAEKAAEKLSERFDVRLLNAYDAKTGEITAEINSADVLLVGTHTINRNAPAEIWQAITGIDLVNRRGMEYIVFGSFGWAGDGIKLINSTLASMGLKRAAKPVEVLFRPTQQDIDNLYKAIDKFNV